MGKRMDSVARRSLAGDLARLRELCAVRPFSGLDLDDATEEFREWLAKIDAEGDAAGHEDK